MRGVCLLSLALCAFGQQSQCVVVTHGTGAQAGDGVHRAQPGDTVTINYSGYLTNGVKFDSSYDRGKPFSTQIGVGQVIQGWDQGVPQLSLGETATLYISAACGYGAQGAPPSIPPNADLIFNVNLLAINGMTQGSAPAPQPQWAPAPQPVSFSGGVSMGASFAPPPSPNWAAPPSAVDSEDGGWTTLPRGVQPSIDGFFPAPAAAPTAARAGLPSCVTETCGRAISWDSNSITATPLCLCNPLCQTMAGTPGILPCCPGLQSVCLDPWRSPSTTVVPPPAPSPQPVAFSQPSSQALPQQHPVQQQPAAHMQQPAQPVHSSVEQQQQQQPVQQQQQQHPVQQQPAAQPQPAPAPATPVMTTLIANTSAPVVKLSPGVCAFSNTKWAPKKTCADKRWTIREGKCKKSCDAASTGAKAQYWPKTQEGHDACVKALATCPK